MQTLRYFYLVKEYSLNGLLNTGPDQHFCKTRMPICTYSSREWGTVPEGAVPVANIDDGEFWMSLKDFIVYFSGITVCSLIPDFDLDGRPDSLSECL